MPLPPRFPGRLPFVPGLGPIVAPVVARPPRPAAPRPAAEPARVPPRAATPRPPAPPVAPAAIGPAPPVVGAAVPADPEPPIAREPPPGINDSKVLADWYLAAIHAHATLRAKSFWDTGHFIAGLLELRALWGAANIKELVSKVPLPMSHMTANKYLQIARTFSRELAVEHGIEKCYALIGYAKAIGRPGEGGAILSANEPIRGARGLYAADASAAALLRAVHALKQAARDSKVPSEARLAYDRTAVVTEKLLRRLGLKSADAHFVRRGGRAQIAIYVPVEVAESLPSALPSAVARFGLRLAKTQPDLFEPLRAAGWRPRARGSG